MKPITYTLQELRAKIASHDYSAELLLQHAMRLLETQASAVAILRDHAEGRIEHNNDGICPDWQTGHDSRDPKCAVCNALNGEESK